MCNKESFKFNVCKKILCSEVSHESGGGTESRTVGHCGTLALWHTGTVAHWHCGTLEVALQCSWCTMRVTKVHTVDVVHA